MKRVIVQQHFGILLTSLRRPACIIYRRNTAFALPSTKSFGTHSAAMERTYENALTQLATLQSNLAIQSMFAPDPAAAAGSSQGGASKAQDLNSVAIAEVVAWLGRAGLSLDDLTRLRCLHVAGTKGKGSVCAYLTSVLTQPAFKAVAGRVGTYTSPHLVTVRERIMLDGQPISQNLFTQYFFEVWDAMTASARAEYLRQNVDGTVDEKLEAELQGPATKPFYFRFLTIMALHVFLREGVRSAIIECGIGGEYDSTNILPAKAVTVGIVTQLGVDHVGMLGGTLSEIAWHKVGIAKSDMDIYTLKLIGEDGEKAMRVMRERASERGARLVEIDGSEVERWGGISTEDAGSLEGQFQKYNQALARAAVVKHLELCAVEHKTGLSDEVMDEGILSGLRQARLRGRCETRTEGDTTWLIDGAHTAESLYEVGKWYAEKVQSHADARKILLFNQQERDVTKLLGFLRDGIRPGSMSESNPFHEAIFTRNDLTPSTGGQPERDLSVQMTAASAFEKLYPTTQKAIFDNVADAIQQARRHESTGNKKTLVLVTGSLHLVGAISQVLEPDAPR